MSSQVSPVPFLKCQMVPRRRLLTSSESKKKESKYACQSEARASHSHKMWAEVSSSAPHLIHKGLSISPIKYRRLPRVLCPVSRPVTALDCVLLKDRSLIFVVGLGPNIKFDPPSGYWQDPATLSYDGYLSSISSFIHKMPPRSSHVLTTIILNFIYIYSFIYFIISHVNLQNIRHSHHYIRLHLFYIEHFTHYFCFYHTMYNISSSKYYA